MASESALPTALVMSFTNLATDPRVHRQLTWLQGRYHIVAMGTAAPKVPDVTYIPATIRFKDGFLEKLPSAWYLLTGQHDRFFWNHEYFNEAVAALDGVRPDVIIANDLDTLPVALRVAHGAPVLFDAHEYYPAEFADQWIWKKLIAPHRWALCAEYLPKASAMLTVCDGIAEEYRRNFHVDPVIVTNAPASVALTPTPTDPARIRMIHHGATMPSRRLECMIEMMATLDDRFELDLMLLVSNKAYLAKLKELAAPYPKVRFLPPVAMQGIVDAIAGYDIGLYLLEPQNFNDSMSFPNKFFEFLQARLAIAIGPSQEMARVVRARGCGVVADDFQPATLARLLNGLTAEQIDGFKRQSDQLAHDFCAERNGETVLALLDRVRAYPRRGDRA